MNNIENIINSTQLNIPSICTKGHLIEVGKLYHYKESYLICQVRVDKITCENGMVDLVLTVTSAPRGSFAVGHVFDVSASTVNVGAYSGMWRLYEDGEYFW